jgi:hypothetical protein
MADTRSRAPSPPSAARRTAKPEGKKPAFAFEERSSDEDIPTLLRRLVDQGTQLAEKQAELVRSEVRESVEDVKMAAGAFAGAAVLAIAGLGVFLMGLAFLLGEVMNLGLATLIVAAATLAGAFALYMGAQSKLRSSSMSAQRTRRTLGRAPDAITGNEERKND